jgi:hypothetical protein
MSFALLRRANPAPPPQVNRGASTAPNALDSQVDAASVALNGRLPRVGSTRRHDCERESFRAVVSRQLRTALAMAAVLLSAVASIATSDCRQTVSMPFEVDGVLRPGQTSQRYHVYAPDAESVELNVAPEFRLTAVATRNGDHVTLGSSTAALTITCRDTSCYGSACPSVCDDLLIEVSVSEASSATDEAAFTLSGLAWSMRGCGSDDVLYETKVEPE